MKAARQLVPLLVAIVLLQLFFRFAVPQFLWIPGPETGRETLRVQFGVERFWTLDNQIGIAEQISINAILAFGMTLTILIGGIDLSVGAMVALVGTTTVYLVSLGSPAVQSVSALGYGIGAGMALAALFGLFNGLCASKTKMPPFIITLATMLIVRGIARRFNAGEPMGIPETETILLGLGSARLLDIVPVPVIVMAVLFVLTAVPLGRFRFGRHIYAIGGNRQAAWLAGIPVVRTEVLVYLICALLAGVAGLVHAAELGAAEPASGEMFELTAIAAAVVGGTSFTGGKGTMTGTLLGAIVIGILDKGLNQAGVHYSFQYIVKGAVILAAVYLNVRRSDR